jgi:predicted glycogen debranching enzyme
MIEGRSIVIQPGDNDDHRRGDEPSTEFESAWRREWLVTNGLGGYASGTLSGKPSRKYHGLFVPNLASPKGRHIMISRCDEIFSSGAHRWEVGGAELAAESARPVRPPYVVRQFRLDRRIAIWQFGFGEFIVEKAITMPHNQNTVCVRYRLLQGPSLQLRLRPFMSFRRHDDTPEIDTGAAFTLNVSRGHHEIRRAGSPITLRLAMQPGPAVFATREWQEHNVFYSIEAERGDPPVETSFSPGYFYVELEAQQSSTFIASTQPWESLTFDASGIFDAEPKRSDALISLGRSGGDPFAEQLTLATDQFIVMPASRIEEDVMAQAGGTDLRTIIAGYHWFGDWGRDTMISLEGLTLSTARYREARAILRTFAGYVKDGLLPNLFPEGERQALYHTVDATLWYFHAIARYVEVTGDRSIVVELGPVLRSIIAHYIAGTHFGIRVDPEDGLVTAAAEGYQLTWMDAKVGDWVVTPRRGKPVEIQALWYNALMLMSDWEPQATRAQMDYPHYAALARHSFNARYWNEAAQCLHDVLDGPTLVIDSSIRPNQVFAISLTYPILQPHRWGQVLETVTSKLLTPYGLRTLSQDHPDYKSHYRGALRERDAAYHQGTVWPWLIGHFIDALLKVHPNLAAARTLLAGFPAHLSEAGVGSISEVFDAEEPYAPGGCIAQAWSVAEVLRAWLKTRGPG